MNTEDFLKKYTVDALHMWYEEGECPECGFNVLDELDADDIATVALFDYQCGECDFTFKDNEDAVLNYL
jgi:DNA-directed RNA polymerase subunit RPC12/RpoP